FEQVHVGIGLEKRPIGKAGEAASRTAALTPQPIQQRKSNWLQLPIACSRRGGGGQSQQCKGLLVKIGRGIAWPSIAIKSMVEKRVGAAISSQEAVEAVVHGRSPRPGPMQIACDGIGEDLPSLNARPADSAGRPAVMADGFVEAAAVAVGAHAPPK